MRDFRLEFSPFTFVALQDVEIEKRVNEHSTAYIKGIIRHGHALNYRDMSAANEHLPMTITAVNSENEKVNVFTGVVTDLSLEYVGDVVTLTAYAKSGSYLMDINRRFRTFQDSSVSYSDVLSLIGRTYSDYNHIMKITKLQELGQFTVQYWETDWAFAKRLASRLNSFVVPADTFPGTRFYFGMPHLNAHILDDSIDYKIVHDYGASDTKLRQGLREANNADAFCYLVRHRDIFAVGDLIKFQNMELYIDRIVTTLAGQELVHTYYLRHKQGLRTARTYNDNMIGASLDAIVLAVQRDEVQVQISGDENSEQSIVQWFPFATVYSSHDGTGWYAMPEQGDQVRLYIADNEEKDAVVFNALHIASEARSNPDIKSMRNKFGKEVRFTPNTLVMTNNAGMEISIIDDEGIRVESNKNIFIKADGDIDITCGAGLSMLASDSVVVQQGSTSLVVDENIAFVGGELRMQ